MKNIIIRFLLDIARICEKTVHKIINISTGEVCQLCGREYYLWFHIDDESWHKIRGFEGGLLCPDCIEKIAQQKKIKYKVLICGDNADFSKFDQTSPPLGCDCWEPK